MKVKCKKKNWIQCYYGRKEDGVIVCDYKNIYIEGCRLDIISRKYLNKKNNVDNALQVNSSPDTKQDE